MRDIENLDVFKPKFISGVISTFKTDPATYRGASFAPIKSSLEEEIVIDVKQYYDGLIPAVAPGAESPIVHRSGRAVMTYKPAYFRGKMLLHERNIQQLRRLGTDNQKETRQELVAGWLADLDRHVELRIEHSRWNALVNGAYTYYVDKQAVTVNYNVPSKFKPTLTGTDKWSDLANSDPIDDLNNWARLFRGSPARLGSIWLNQKVLNYLLHNEKIRDLIKTYGKGAGIGHPTLATVTDVLKAEIPGFAGIEVYDEGYNVHTFVTTSAASGQKDVVVEDATYIEVGDTVTLKSSDYSQQEDYVVASKSGNTLTMTVNLSSTFAVGAEAVIFKPFIPDNKVILKGVVPAGEIDMAFITTPSAYNGGLLNPRPGKFGKRILYDQDPPKIELVAGIYGLPILRNDTNIIATVA